MSRPNSHYDVTPPLDPRLEHLASRVARKVRESQPAPVRHKTFLGLDSGGWTRLLVPIVLSAIIAGVIFWAGLQRTLDGKVEMPALKEAILLHEDRGEHQDLEAEVKELKTTQQEIKTSLREIQTSLQHIKQRL